MATKLTGTGVTFPDLTVQTTAATSSGGTLEAVASGSLSDGSTVIVNTDGTVSVVTSSVTFNPSVFENASTDDPSATYDSTNNKVVVAYRDGGNSNYGTAVVGEVSGLSISFGTPTVFQSAASNLFSAVYDTNQQKVVICYQQSVNAVRAVVGTVSGNSISFGSSVAASSVYVQYVTAVYNTAAQKIVVTYQNQDNSGYPTSVVGTVSGTSISFGTPAVVASVGSQFVASAYDSAAQKIIVAYQDAEPPGYTFYGKAAVGTVSGTSISFGSSATFAAVSVSGIKISFDTQSNKALIGYKDQNNSNYGTAIVGTVSGTSISFGTKVVFNSANTSVLSVNYDSVLNKSVIFYSDLSSFGVAATVSGTTVSFGSPITTNPPNSAVFDASNNKFVLVYKDGSNSNYGTAVQFSLQPTNLTAENFIGISDGAYANAATATVLIAGSVSEAQSGLTAGQSYYVQTDGTLSTTPDDPSVFAGTAISATKIVVQG